MQLTIGKEYATKVYLVEEGNTLEMLSESFRDYLIDTIGFTGKLNENYVYIGPKTDNLIVVGLGASEKIKNQQYIYAANTAANLLNDNKVTNASVHYELVGNVDAGEALQAVAEGFLQSRYHFDTYLTKKTEKSLAEVSFETDLAVAEKLIAEIEAVINGVDLTRELVNTPANDLYPENFANQILDLFKDKNVEVKVYDKAALEDIGAKALLAVAQGSAKEPRLIVMEYLPLGQDVPAVSLVGKGVTYDSGGYAIKPAQGMDTMMTDMAGAAAMVGTLQAIVENEIQQNVVAIIGATENLISGEAMKNGDIISSMKGTSIEVINTDAEGRLVLADALYYAATKVNSKCIVNAATLTGAVIAALGMDTTGVMTNDEALLADVLKASEAADEAMWQLPLTDEFRESVKGKNADLINSMVKGTGAGTSFASAFLEHFVEDVPWVHLDIAGTSYAKSKGNKYRPRGASGIPVKTLYQFVKDSVKE